MSLVGRVVQRADAIQRRVPWLGFPLAVLKKYGDDSAGNLAALMAYYAFLSVFPLLLVFVTVLGFVLRGNPDLYRRLLSSALVEFPVIGEQLRFNELHGSWWVLIVSILISLWGARGVSTAAMNAFNGVWNVPYAQRPGFGPGLARSFGLLATLGVTVLVTGTLSGLGGMSDGLGLALRAGAIVLSTLVNIGLFLLAFRLATARVVGTRDMLLGAVVSAVLWQLLLAVGALLVTHQVRHAQSLYGVFGVVLGLLAWLQLQAQLTLYAMEADVVRARGLWPRSVNPPPLTRADRRAYTGYVEAERRLPTDEQRVAVHFLGEAPGDPLDGSAPDGSASDGSAGGREPAAAPPGTQGTGDDEEQAEREQCQ
jgi:YihY family inner membrane protein